MMPKVSPVHGRVSVDPNRPPGRAPHSLSKASRAAALRYGTTSIIIVIIVVLIHINEHWSSTSFCGEA